MTDILTREDVIEYLNKYCQKHNKSHAEAVQDAVVKAYLDEVRKNERDKIKR